MKHALTRRSVRSVLAIAAAAVLATTAARADDAKTYAVKLTRPAKVGQEFELTCKADVVQKVKITQQGQAQNKDDKYTAELSGTLKVVSINNKTGEATKVSVTVEKLTKDGADLFPAGTVITADHTGEKEKYMVGGGEVSPEQAEVLGSVIDVGRTDREVTDDQMLGTAEKQAVGGTWDASKDKLATELNDAKVPVSAEHLSGTSKLVAVKDVDGAESEVIEMTVKADPLESGKEVQQITVTGGSFESTITLTEPTDAEMPPTMADEHDVFKMTGTAGGGAVTADLNIERTIHRTMKLKK